MNVKRCSAFGMMMFVLALSIYASERGGGKGGGSRGSHGGSVYVHGYTRKDGTHVNGYVRSAPGSGSSSSLHETDLDANRPGSPSEPTLADIHLRRSAPQAAITPAKKQSSPSAPPTIPRVTVLADSITKRYYRSDCTAPATAKPMQRTAAISAGYRPARDCYGHH